MTTPKDWRPSIDADDFFRNMEKRMSITERQPNIRKASDLVGPGIASYAIRLLDWNSQSARHNGFWITQDAANGPVDELGGPLMGITVASETGEVVQVAFAQGNGPMRMYSRQVTAPGGIAPDFQPWQAVFGGEQTAQSSQLWYNGGSSNINIGEVAWFGDVFTEGEVRRTDSTVRPCPLIAIERVVPGEWGRFAAPGSIVNVVCDVGGIAIGDSLVVSTSQNAAARSDNAETQSRFIMGYARSAKGFGASGVVSCYVT